MQLPVNPLGSAALFGAQAAVSQTVRTAAQANQAAGDSAAQTRDADVVSLSTREIDDSGASVDDRDADGRTPWHFTPPPTDEDEESARPKDKSPHSSDPDSPHLDTLV
jgi:hypothetical protein